MVAALALGSTSVFAQKFASIDYQGIIFAMPDMTAVQESLTKTQTEYQEQLESVGVEYNTLMQEFQNLPEGTSEAIRQLKQRDLIAIQQRQEEYYQIAQEGIQRAQMELMAPVQEKVDTAIKNICKAQSIVAVFQSERIGADLVFLDEDMATDITEAVCKELGVTFPLPALANPAAAPATAPVQ